MTTRHHELRLGAKRGSLWILRQALEFASKSKGWRPHPNGIVPAGGGIGPHCVVLYTQRKPVACVAVVTNPEAPETSVRLTNVFPGECGHIPPTEYNSIVERFLKDFRAFLRKNKIVITSKLTKFKLSLETAIPSAKCRALFQSYLSQFPLTCHPCDIDNLDQFICAAHRYQAKIDTDALVSYLTEQRNWPEPAANIVLQRILVGSSILRAYTRYRP